MLLVLALLLSSTTMGFAIVTVCYLFEVCITVYHITSMIEIQMYYHAYSTLGVLQHYDGLSIVTVCYLS